MSLYAGRSVATLEVWNRKAGSGASAAFPGDVPSSLEVSDLLVEFRVKIAFHDHPYVDNGRGRFKVWLDVARANSGFVQVDYKEKDLGNDNDDGDWSDYLKVKHTMSQPMEVYRVRIECRTKDSFPENSVDASKTFTCTQAVNFIGDFTLDYIPLSIVYGPPGQDMTNSLSQTEQFGSQFTIGETWGMQATQGVHAGGSLFGIISFEASVQESQSVSSTAQNSLRTSYFRNNVVTVDNQRAVGRAYWGPLSDVFVVMVNPKFAASRRADGTIFYEHRNCDQVILVPAHKLLRPNGDKVAESIPEGERRKLLELDPFITNLNRFFPDVGTDLKEAANPYADPSADGRAECIGLWHMSTGVELNYSMGDEIELRQGSTRELTWSTTMHGSAAIVIGGNFDVATTVGIQWSLESSRRLAKSASCYLIKNQNDPEPEGIKMYYDKIFSTLMFRKLRPDGFKLPTKLPSDVFVDLPPELVWQRILDLLPDLGMPEIKPPRKPPVLSDPKFGLPEAFPDLPGEIVDRLVEAVSTEAAPRCSIAGFARDSEKYPVYHETVTLRRGKKVYYRTFTDGMGNFRFDNVVPGKYIVRVGAREEEIVVERQNTYSMPKEVTLEEASHALDLTKMPRAKLQSILGVDNVAIAKLGREGKKLKDLKSVTDVLQIPEARMRALARRLKKV